MDNKYVLDKNSKLVISYVQGSSEKRIFVKDDNNKLSKMIYSIDDPLFIDEVDIGFPLDFLDDDLTKLVVGYNKNDESNAVIEFIEINLTHKKIINKRSIYFNKVFERLYPGIYLCEDQDSSKIIITSNNKKLNLSNLSHFYSEYGQSLNIDDVLLSSFDNKTKRRHHRLLEMQFKIGDYDSIHSVLKLPSGPYDDFKVSKYVYSERFDKIYNIASKKDKKYIYFDKFIKKFFNSELAFKIMDMMESSRKGNNRLVKKK